MKKQFNSRAFNRKYNYSGEDLGASYSTQVSIFKVWSPKAKALKVILYKTGDKADKIEEVEMERCTKGIWKASIYRDLEGVYYTYLVDQGEGNKEVIDPYAKACGVNGKRGMVIDLSKTNPAGWENQKRPILQNATDAIIYEMHVRDFSIDPNGRMKHKGKFLALTEDGTKSINGETTGVDHIEELGVTHVQLMPSYDYLTVDESKMQDVEYNWGYDPLNYNIPEGSYATDPYHGEVRIKEFKQAIMALHKKGLGVIMDVVYNHTALSKDSNFNILMPNYYYRTTESGKFFNGSACGNEIASERYMVRKMIIDSLVYWTKEYKIDGFRFDLMGVLDIQTMREIYKTLKAINPQVILYGEGWAGGICGLSEKKRALKVNAPLFNPVGVFNDDLRDSVKGDVFEAGAKGFINGGEDMEESIKFGIVAATKHPQIRYSKVNYSDAPYAKQPGQTINYVSAHDNLTLWDKLQAVQECTNHESQSLQIAKEHPDTRVVKEKISKENDEEKAIKNTVIYEKQKKDTNLEEATQLEQIKRQKLANAIVLTAQGVPFLHAGVEFARTKKGDDNSYKSGDEINKIDWLRKNEFKEVFEYYKGLIQLRKEHPAFRMRSSEEIRRHLRFLDMPSSNMVGYKLINHAGNDKWREIVVLLNGNIDAQKIQLPGSNHLIDLKEERIEWDIVVDSNKAGVKTIRKITDSQVSIEGLTAMVLVRD